MTDREKLFELLHDGKNHVWGWFLNNVTMLQVADYLISNGVTVAKSATVRSEWIPVIENPPPYGETVLCYRSPKDIRTGELVSIHKNGFAVFTDREWHTKFCATYWAPLPEIRRRADDGNLQA